MDVTKLITRECGALLRRMAIEWEAANRYSHLGSQNRVVGEYIHLVKKNAGSRIISEYISTLQKLEHQCEKSYPQQYLFIRRARCAVIESMTEDIEPQVLYQWMVQNICDIEGASSEWRGINL